MGDKADLTNRENTTMACNYSYCEVVCSAPSQIQRATTSATRTITLQPKDYKKAGKIVNLINNLEELKVDNYIEGTRSIGSIFIIFALQSLLDDLDVLLDPVLYDTWLAESIG